MRIFIIGARRHDDGGSGSASESFCLEFCNNKNLFDVGVPRWSGVPAEDHGEAGRGRHRGAQQVPCLAVWCCYEQGC